MSTKSQEEVDEERYLSDQEEEAELLRTMRSQDQLPDPANLPTEYADALAWMKTEKAKRMN